MIYLKKILAFSIFLIAVLSIYGIINNKESDKTDSLLNENNEKLDELEKQIADMTIEEKVGQMFIVRCPKENAAALVSQYHLGGYILFSRDFEDKTKEEVINNISSYQENAEIPLLIGVDEEGGTVTRISKYKEFREEPFASPQELYNEGGLSLIRENTLDKSAFLKALGINVNFAPVSDVSTNPSDYIYNRTIGLDANMTSQYVAIVVTAMKEAKIGSVLKHFPGYGNNVDTHTGISIDTRSYETFVEQDFLPFASGIKAGADIVLVSHNIVTSMDPDYPASLSKNVHDILRNELDFDGVIVTDDLYMDAIKDYVGNEEAAVKAIMAENDLICTTDFETQIPAVIEAVKNGTISESEINASVKRILNLKSELNLI